MAAETETELKFDLRPGEVEGLRRSGAVDDLAVGKSETETLVSTYYDTPERALRAAAVSLRIRRKGRRIEQTVKTADRPIGALAERREVTVPLAGEAPDLGAIGDGELEARIRALIGDGELVELFTIRMTRTHRLLVTRGGDEIEYAVDDAEIVAGERRATFAEAEFELKSGDPRALFHVARQALATVPVRFSDVAKSERGYRLAEAGEAVAPPAPAKADEPAITADMTVEVALRAVLRSCFAQIAANAVVVQESADPEGPHQLRVGLRRLRSALSIFGKVIDRPAAARLIEETRWLAGVVGELRDLDVLAEEIVAPCAGRVDAEPLLAVLAARRTALRADLVTTLGGPRVGAFLIDLAAYVEGRGWLSFTDLGQSQALAAPAEAFAEEALRRLWSKVARMGRDVDALSGEERHDLRKAFKKLRYGLDFFGREMSSRDRRRALRDVKAAQDVLGYLNDVLMAERMVGLVHAAPEYAGADVAAIERAMGYCLGWHQARAEAIWEEAKARVSLDPDEV